jgi:Glycosyl transferases group 1
MCEPEKLDVHCLVIDARTGGDWSIDLIFAGLVQKFGPMRVFDFPRKEKHREWVGPDDPTNDWGKERRTLGYTGFNVSSDKEEILRLARKGKLLVFMDERDETHEVYYRLFGNLPVPVVIVAGHDRFWNVSPEHVIRKFAGRLRRLFIDNWRPEYDALPVTSLINWSANFDHYWKRPAVAPEKDVDIFFVGYNSHPDRARFVDFIESHPLFGRMRNHIVLERNAGTAEKYVSKREYFELMLRSKLCLNLRGAAVCGKTLRFLEIPYVGSVMLSQRFDDRQLFPFVHGEHCVYFSNEQELENMLVDLLLIPGCTQKREDLARRGHEHLAVNHSVRSRIEYVMQEVERGSR